MKGLVFMFIINAETNETLWIANCDYMHIVPLLFIWNNCDIMYICKFSADFTVRSLPTIHILHLIIHFN